MNSNDRLAYDELGVSLSLAAAGYTWSPRPAGLISAVTTTASSKNLENEEHPPSLGAHPTLVTLEISPTSTGIDLKALYEDTLIKDFATMKDSNDAEIHVRWGQHCQLQEVAFGAQRLVCTLTVRDAVHAERVVETLQCHADIQTARVSSLTSL